MAFEFVPATDPRTRFTATVQVNGTDYEFSVPRLDFISDEVFHNYMQWTDTHDDQTIVKDGGRPVAAHFDYLVNALGIDHAATFTQGLVYGEKAQLWEEWNRVSTMPLGEFLASSSSPSTPSTDRR